MDDHDDMLPIVLAVLIGMLVIFFIVISLYK